MMMSFIVFAASDFVGVVKGPLSGEAMQMNLLTSYRGTETMSRDLKMSRNFHVFMLFDNEQKRGGRREGSTWKIETEHPNFFIILVFAACQPRGTQDCALLLVMWRLKRSNGTCAGDDLVAKGLKLPHSIRRNWLWKLIFPFRMLIAYFASHLSSLFTVGSLSCFPASRLLLFFRMSRKIRPLIIVFLNFPSPMTTD